MARGAWQATVHGAARVRHDLATKPPLLNPSDQNLAKQHVRWGLQTQPWWGLEALAAPGRPRAVPGWPPLSQVGPGFLLPRPGQGLCISKDLKRLPVGL